MGEKVIGIILAAGKGTRMNSKIENKVAHLFLGKPIILYGVELFEKICDELIIVVGAFKQSIENIIKENKITLDSIEKYFPKYLLHPNNASYRYNLIKSIFFNLTRIFLVVLVTLFIGFNVYMNLSIKNTSQDSKTFHAAIPRCTISVVFSPKVGIVIFVKTFLKKPG